MGQYKVNNVNHNYSLNKQEKQFTLKEYKKEYNLQSRGLTGIAGQGSDKHFAQPFSASATVICNHSLNKQPAITIVNTAGDEVVGEITNITLNSLTVLFKYPESGTVYLN